MTQDKTIEARHLGQAASCKQEESRFGRWVKASYATAQYERFMPVTIQGLGKLDQDLVIQDRLLIAGLGPFALDGDPMELSRHLTLSYLWVLGAYEVLRAINQQCKESHGASPAVLHVLRQFERLRMPLAKFEPAYRHRNTDSKIAYPALNSEYGIAWEVAPDVFIPRGALSDELLALLETM